jgi:hypothetical protein
LPRQAAAIVARAGRLPLPQRHQPGERKLAISNFVSSFVDNFLETSPDSKRARAGPTCRTLNS